MSEYEITKEIDHPSQEDDRKPKINNYNEFFNPFISGINLWKNYSII
ncbi:MAG: hypothetical protein M3Z01_04955 [Thermoproteota archaeon]|nr:hypothetical protein [Thermoproteota archaeon]